MWVYIPIHICLYKLYTLYRGYCWFGSFQCLKREVSTLHLLIEDWIWISKSIHMKKGLLLLFLFSIIFLYLLPFCLCETNFTTKADDHNKQLKQGRPRKGNKSIFWIFHLKTGKWFGACVCFIFHVTRAHSIFRVTILNHLLLQYLLG